MVVLEGSEEYHESCPETALLPQSGLEPRSHVGPAANAVDGVPLSLSKSRRKLPVGQTFGASTGCAALLGVVRSWVASTAFPTLVQVAAVKPCRPPAKKS